MWYNKYNEKDPFAGAAAGLWIFPIFLIMTWQNNIMCYNQYIRKQYGFLKQRGCKKTHLSEVDSSFVLWLMQEGFDLIHECEGRRGEFRFDSYGDYLQYCEENSITPIEEPTASADNEHIVYFCDSETGEGKFFRISVTPI